MKYTIKLFIQIIILLLIRWNLASQLKSLSIGDKIPNITINILNNNNQSKKLYDYKGKLILIDFWATYCLSCIEHIPELEIWQKKYKDRLQLLYVTQQPKAVVTRFLDKRQQMTNTTISFPVISDDTLLSKLFVHNELPHYVWIDPGGIVKYFTGLDEVNEKNIVSVINNITITPQPKTDVFILPIPEIPLFINQNGGDGSGLINYSVLSGDIKGMPSISGIFNSVPGQSVALAFSQTVKSIFQIAYNDFLNEYYIPNNRTLFQVKDSTKYASYFNNSYYNYQLITPRKSYKEMQHLMQEEIKKYFNLDARMEKRKVKCWVLTAADTSLISSKGGRKKDSYDLVEYTLTMKNVSMVDLQRRFIYNLIDATPFPFVDETNIKGNIDIILENFRSEDPTSLQRAVEKAGLQLKIEERKVNMLVITEHEVRN